MKFIDADKKYLDQYREAYIESLKQIKQGKMKKHDLMFENPDEVDIIKKCKDNRDESKLPSNYVPSYDYFMLRKIN